ncbi:rhomboid family intramembrane serine protease [Cognatilysobacter lacus]|uniref:Rhomboid family intramembrane serine protease n=1 Tax=Cognatilysobacter lacus TaxID=1643323 RepID=A0A5D8Z3T1_9GAMM|nr:rhomboid family intramembrane serine protease [Lysobacter lacus]TZF89196.1 rhomboid family intramembrane serine protease [Lysobacter lacus]
MHLHTPAPPLDPIQQRRLDAQRWRRAFNLSLAAVLLVLVVYAMQSSFDVDAWTVRPHLVDGLRGVVTAPLLHGSVEHVGGNALGLLAIGTLTIAQYPRALLRTLPLAWLGSGLAAWWLGDPGSQHLGASGVINGMLFMVLTLGLVRRDRPAVAAAMLGLTLFGGMLLSVLPHEAGVSWQSHLGGAIGGVLGGLWGRHADPMPPRVRYSWDEEDEAAGDPPIEAPTDPQQHAA